MFSSVDKHGLEGNVCDFFVCKPPAGLECKVVQKFRRSTCFPIPPLSFLVCYQIREWNLTKPYLSREFYTFLWFVLEQQINISNVGFSVLINSRGMSNVWWERVQKGQRASLIFQRIVHLFQGNKEKNQNNQTHLLVLLYQLHIRTFQTAYLVCFKHLEVIRKRMFSFYCGFLASVSPGDTPVTFTLKFVQIWSDSKSVYWLFRPHEDGGFCRPSPLKPPVRTPCSQVCRLPLFTAAQESMTSGQENTGKAADCQRHEKLTQIQHSWCAESALFCLC